jgi:predicted phage-related endonuclease
MSMLYPKTRDEWLELRWKHISSTESAALFGMSPYLTMFELAVLKKAESVPEEYEQNERMTWGLRLQRAIAQGIAEDYGVKIRAVSGYASRPDKLGASFDYEIIGLKEVNPPDDTKAWEGDQTLRDLYRQFGPGVLEIKNVDSLVFKNEWAVNEDKSIEAPAHIELQVQHQLLCIEREWAAIGVLVGGNRQHLIARMRDRDVGTRIEAKAGKFWRGIAAGHMPPVTYPQDADIIRKIYGFAEPGKVIDGQKNPTPEQEALYQLAWQHDEATKLKSAAEKHHKSTGAALMMAMGDAEKALFADISISAGVVGPTRVEAYDRAGYRNLRVYPKKPKEAKQ